MSNPLELLNKFIGAIIAYGPKNKTKKARMAKKASDEAGLITGSTLSANGGQYLA